ncbi:MAG: hypothetical protein IJT62_07265 [Oscillospiraceae bacterium]|nr:hypothetical protein [Oscillospiraceae bacterium]
MKKKTIYSLAVLLAFSFLVACGRNGATEVLPDGSPIVSASPMVVTPDMNDGVVRDDDGIITDSDTGNTATSRPETSPSASPAEKASAKPTATPNA